MANEIPLRKEIVTIGFSIMNKLPSELKEPFKSFLLAIDDDDVHNAFKKYDDLSEMANKHTSNEYALPKAFLFLVFNCIYENKSTGSKSDTVKEATSKMTDEQFVAEIDNAFTDVMKEEEGDIIAIDPKSIDKAKKKPGDGKPASGEWIPW